MVFLLRNAVSRTTFGGNFAESSAGDDGEAYASGIIPQEDYNDGTLWRQLIASTKSRKKSAKNLLGKERGLQEYRKA